MSRNRRLHCSDLQLNFSAWLTKRKADDEVSEPKWETANQMQGHLNYNTSISMWRLLHSRSIRTPSGRVDVISLSSHKLSLNFIITMTS